MTEVSRKELEKKARDYIASVQKLHGGCSVPTPIRDKAIRETVRASERFVKARRMRVVA